MLEDVVAMSNQFHRRAAPVEFPYGDVSKRQRTEQPKPPCAFFRVGRCAKGANCPYTHEDGEVAEVRTTNSHTATVAVPVQRKVPQVVPPPADRPVSRHSPAPVPADDSSTMFKRTLCKFFLNGCCVNGEMCTFAHGEHELQQPAEGGTWVFIPSTASTKMGATSSWGAPASVSRKTQLCAYFEAGFCKKGAGCNFAHGSSELAGPPLAWREPAKGGVPRAFAAVQPKEESERCTAPGEFRADHYKTRMCKFFLEGNCAAGAECRYAHDESELPASGADPLKDEGASHPPREKHVFFKTRLCHLHAKGMCHRDSACNYAHGYEELRKPAVSEGEPGTSSNFGIVVPSMAGGATEKLGDMQNELTDRALCS
eukprot:s462_g8.t1